MKYRVAFKIVFAPCSYGNHKSRMDGVTWCEHFNFRSVYNPVSKTGRGFSSAIGYIFYTNGIHKMEVAT